MAGTEATRRFAWSWLAAAAVLGVVLRLGFALGYWTNQPLTRDEREYLSLARSLAAGAGFTYDADMLGGPIEPFGRAPGYPAFLAIAGGGGAPGSRVPDPVKVVQSLIGGLAVVLTGMVAWRLAGPRAGRSAAVIAACYPPLVWIAAYALSEALFWPMAMGVVLLFDRIPSVDRRRAAWPAIACGVLAGAAVLVRPALLVMLPMAFVWLLWKRLLRGAILLAVGSTLVIVPWTIRNYVHDHRFVLVASDGGVTFWTGNNALAHGEGDMAANPDLKRASQALRADHPGLNEAAMEPVYYREAWSWITSHPTAWLWLEVRKAFYLVVPIGPSYRLHSVRYYLASIIPYALLLPAAIVGFWQVGARRAAAPGLWLLAAASIAVCLVFFPQERFRIPVLDPALIVCAAALDRPRAGGA